jgi:hypothetical protein
MTWSPEKRTCRCSARRTASIEGGPESSARQPGKAMSQIGQGLAEILQPSGWIGCRFNAPLMAERLLRKSCKKVQVTRCARIGIATGVSKEPAPVLRSARKRSERSWPRNSVRWRLGGTGSIDKLASDLKESVCSASVAGSSSSFQNGERASDDDPIQ